jgi:uncharacterized protein (TIGR03435 family)
MYGEPDRLEQVRLRFRCWIRQDCGGFFDFSVDIHPELGTDMFTSWQRALEDQLGLRIESRKENVAVLVVDEAARIPTEN